MKIKRIVNFPDKGIRNGRLYQAAILIMLSVMYSCSNEIASPMQTGCKLLQYGDFELYNYDSIVYDANGIIDKVYKKQPGGNQEYNYIFGVDKLQIFKSDLGVQNELVAEFVLSASGKPLSLVENGVITRKFYYSGDYLDYQLWPATQDSLVYYYVMPSLNPVKVEIYRLDTNTGNWNLTNSTSCSYDDKSNPLQGLILPIENWNLEDFYFQNNRTSYLGSDPGSSPFSIEYSYNELNYPLIRTLTWNNFLEKKEFRYNCQ